MVLRNRKHIAFETLESRRVLNGQGVVGFESAQPRPMDNSVGLVSFSAVHRLVFAGDYHSQIEVANADSDASNAVPSENRKEFLVAGDFNADQTTDFLSADAVGNWYLHLNDGTKLFEIEVGTGIAGVEHVGTADFNGDGLLDLLSLDATTGVIWVSIKSIRVLCTSALGRVLESSWLDSVIHW